MATDSHVCLVDGKHHELPLGDFFVDGARVRNVCTLHQQLILQMLAQIRATPEDYAAVADFLGVTSPVQSAPAA